MMRKPEEAEELQVIALDVALEGIAKAVRVKLSNVRRESRDGPEVSVIRMLVTLTALPTTEQEAETPEPSVAEAVTVVIPTPQMVTKPS
jgi:hypothetical protein